MIHLDEMTDLDCILAFVCLIFAVVIVAAILGA